jgi:hypothetical protein
MIVGFVVVISQIRLSETSMDGYAPLIVSSRPCGDANLTKKRKWRVEQVPIDLEPIQGFNLRAQVVGHGGAYVKHIQQETGCRVQIKGRGSGYIESSTGQESDDDMYLHVT